MVRWNPDIFWKFQMIHSHLSTVDGSKRLISVLSLRGISFFWQAEGWRSTSYLSYVMLQDVPLHNLKWLKNSLALSQVFTFHSFHIWSTSSLEMKTHCRFPYMMWHWSWSFHYEFVLRWRINLCFQEQSHFDVSFQTTWLIFWNVSVRFVNH